jgi:hypothetical protein
MDNLQDNYMELYYLRGCGHMLELKTTDPSELTVLATIFALTLAKGRGSSEVSVIGTFLSSVGAMLQNISSQKEYLEKVEETMDKIQDLKKEICNLQKKL